MRVKYVKYYKLFVCVYIYICIYIYMYIKALLHVSGRDDDTKEFIYIKLKRRNLHAVHQKLLVTIDITI